MAAWANGYVRDIEYSSHFYRELSPAHLSFAALGQGVRPPLTGDGATYCELGCGQGLGTIIVAATHPRMHVWGFDFNPAHISNAQRLAAEARLENITFADHSFEQLLALPAGSLPSFDYITLHGIYSWISPENRRFIVQFIDRHLKPGGLVYVSYNCLPGWSTSAPLQRLLREHALRGPDRSDRQMEAALGFTKKLMDAKAVYFEQNPSVGKRFEKLPTSDKHYLAHEYLNGHWHPLFHLDVAREMEAARLTYVASATLVENIDRVSLPPTMVALVGETQDPAWREMLRDYARNQQFRRDIFMRGASRMTSPEQSARIGAVQVGLTVPRDSVKLSIETPLGTIKADESTCMPMLDALSRRSHSIAELAALPALKGKKGGAALLALNLLIHAGCCHPFHNGGTEAWEQGQSLNQAIAARLPLGDLVGYVAIPAAGTGVRATFVELVLLHGLMSGVSQDARKLAEFAWSVMERSGRRLVKDQKRVETKQENLALLEAELPSLIANSVPMWKSLGIL